MNSRSSADNIIYNCDSPAFDGRLQRSREAVLDRMQPLACCICEALGVDEITTEFKRNQQRDERALDERTAYRFSFAPRELSRELSGKRSDLARVQE